MRYNHSSIHHLNHGLTKLEVELELEWVITSRINGMVVFAYPRREMSQFERN